ncbi:hypothetical protein G5C51_01745 [Streptomyces sp. A7024]|uniref:Uncharacterized protein n=2 Tax=Streptomyces coryli TaxID=1128680 RepID=A0A6G4TU52_9ACTN|nr:hypothetical protein [Streptomyces coryli]
MAEKPAVDAGRLWGGGLATAVVAALVALVGVLIARGVFDVALLARNTEGAFGDSSTTAYVVTAALAAIIATLILQILVALTPQPLGFFSWIIGLTTLIFAVVPFTTDAKPATQWATALINLAVGLVIVILLPQIGYSALQPRTEQRTQPRT